MLYGGILKEGGQIPKYRVPVFPVFRYRYYIDTEPVFYEVRYRIPILEFRYFRFFSVSVSITARVALF